MVYWIFYGIEMFLYWILLDYVLSNKTSHKHPTEINSIQQIIHGEFRFVPQRKIKQIIE